MPAPARMPDERDAEPGREGVAMIFVLLLIPVGLSIWFLVFVLFKDSIRARFVSGVRSPTIRQPHGVASEADVPPLSGWTALDDQQLARFLKGSAP
jgi:hypothetical protein